MFGILPDEVLCCVLDCLSTKHESRALLCVLLMMRTGRGEKAEKAVSAPATLGTLWELYQSFPTWPSVKTVVDHELRRCWSGVDYYTDRITTYTQFRMLRKRKLVVALKEVRTPVEEPRLSESRHDQLQYTAEEIEEMQSLSGWHDGPWSHSMKWTFTSLQLQNRYATAEHDFYAFVDQNYRPGTNSCKRMCVFKQSKHGTGPMSVFTFLAQKDMTDWIRRVKRGEAAPMYNAHLSHQLPVPELAAQFVRAKFLAHLDPPKRRRQ